MAERVYPSAKPTTTPNTVAPPPSVSAPPGTTKPQIYHPNRQPYTHSRRTRRKRCSCCCCFFWTLLIILSSALIIAIAGVVFWVVYRPHYPVFTVSNFRIANLNLTTTSDTAHLASSMNLTLSTTNRNKKISFFYDQFDLSVFSNSNVRISNGSAPGFISWPTDGQTMKVELKRVGDLDVEEAKGLKSDLKKKSLGMKVRVETNVRVKIGKMKTRRVGIRVTCKGIRGNAPTGKAATVASTADAKCDVDLRFKIWRFTF